MNLGRKSIINHNIFSQECPVVIVLEKKGMNLDTDIFM